VSRPARQGREQEHTKHDAPAVDARSRIPWKIRPFRGKRPSERPKKAAGTLCAYLTVQTPLEGSFPIRANQS
jgi:hypothetical protein